MQYIRNSYNSTIKVCICYSNYTAFCCCEINSCQFALYVFNLVSFGFCVCISGCLYVCLWCCGWNCISNCIFFLGWCFSFGFCLNRYPQAYKFLSTCYGFFNLGFLNYWCFRYFRASYYLFFNLCFYFFFSIGFFFLSLNFYLFGFFTSCFFCLGFNSNWCFFS